MASEQVHLPGCGQMSPPTVLTKDIPDAFFGDLIVTAARCGRTDRAGALDFCRPLFNESGLSYQAHNPNGDAAGIFQAMPFILRGLGAPEWRLFTQLDADQQLPFMEKYYRPYSGRLVNATAIYLATFAPAMLGHAGDSGYLICAADGSSGMLGQGTSKIWYAANRGLDVDGDKRITVGDLTAAIARADVGPRWDEICARLAYALDAVDGVGFDPGLNARAEE